MRAATTALFTTAALSIGQRRPAPARHETGSEGGSASVLALGVIGVVFVLTAAVVALLGATMASHRARTAADLGALAGAQVLNEGAAMRSPCQAAAEIVSHNRSALLGCRVSGSIAEVQVQSPSHVPGFGPATARARAGPDPGAGPPAALPGAGGERSHVDG